MDNCAYNNVLLLVLLLFLLPFPLPSFFSTTSHVAWKVKCHQPNPTASIFSKWLEGCRVLASNFIFKFQISPALLQWWISWDFRQLSPPLGGWEWTKDHMMAGWLVSLSQNGRPATCFCPTENLPFSFTTSHVAWKVKCHQPNPTASIFSKWLEGCRVLASNFIFKFQISPALLQWWISWDFRQLSPPPCTCADGLHLMQETFDTSPSVNSWFEAW